MRLESDITLHKKNEVYLQVECERSIARELNEFFSFDIPEAKFMPAYKNRFWDGKIRLFDTRTNQIYSGLYNYIKEFAEKRSYSLTGGNWSPLSIHKENVESFISRLGIPYEARDYQVDAVHHCIRTGRSLLVSPTASGKSLIIYILIRYYQKFLHDPGKDCMLLLVPTTSLVEQMFSDFQEYGWNSDYYCHRIYSGREKQAEGKIVYISTWQSLYKEPQSYFRKFRVIFGDEAHTFKADSLKKIMNKTISTEYKFGLTGTLNDTQSHRLVLEGLFGPVKQVTTTRQLIDKKQLSDLKVTGIVLTYSKEECIIRKYQDEIKYITQHPKRNNLIRNLSVDQKGNTLVLFSLIKHGELLFKLIKEKTNDVHLVYGATDTETREGIRKLTEQSNGRIIVASFGVFSTGINIRNLHNIIFASPYKSRIRNLQSIGRGLRLHDSKVSAKLYDIADDFDGRNHTIKHFAERISIYNQEEFVYEIHKVQM